MAEDHVTIEREPQLFAQSAGEQLKAAREDKGLTIEQLAAETKIPLRQLELIEDGAFDRLPGRTYAIGFSRTYARQVGLDEGEVLNKVRAELSTLEPERGHVAASHLEPGDPARVPSSGLAWMLAVAAVILVAGSYTAYRTFISPDGALPPIAEQQAAEAAAPSAEVATTPAPAQAAVQGGAVVFTAIEDGVWVKFYDADGRQLMQKQMALGETYTVPTDVDGPQVWTGRPDALSITVGGREVPKIAEREGIVKDVPVTAEALLARNTPTVPSAGASPTI